MKTANTLWRDLLRQVRLFPLAALLLTALPLAAQVPSLINYQGRLTDAQGQPVTGNRTMTVRLYDAASGGNMTYEETLGTVAVGNGTYSFQFGASGNGVVTVLSGQDYLALSVNGTEESTRTRLLAVPYALKSADAQALRQELVAAGLLLSNATTNMVTVGGGTLPQSSGLSGQIVSTFHIGKYEVSWGEWKEVRAWGVANGYSDLDGVGDTYPSGSADNFPVINVSWYDVVKWMNAKSEKEGLTPVYQVSGAVYKTGQSAPKVISMTRRGSRESKRFRASRRCHTAAGYFSWRSSGFVGPPRSRISFWMEARSCSALWNTGLLRASPGLVSRSRDSRVSAAASSWL